MVKKGTRFHAGYADSCPEWEVTRSRGKDVWEATESIDWSGVTKVFTTDEIESSLRRASAFDRHFNETDKWWADQPLGSILHYEDSRNKWVRGIVVDHNGKREFKPIALVGNGWPAYDLPRRQPDGSIRYSYHAKKIIEGGEPYQPNVIYERKLASGQAPYAYQGAQDPRDLDPIDLSVPDMTPQEQETARLEKLRQQLRTELNNPDVRHALTTVQRLLLPEFAA